MKRLIVTGDDFGVSLAVNEAIERAHRQGILNTASLMVAEAEVEDAVRRARALPLLKVGLHLVVVRGASLLPRNQIPDLVGDSGQFDTHLFRAGVNFFFRPAVRRQLEAEIRAQFERFRATALALDHVNAHNHLHLHPTILGLMINVGRDFGSPPVRVPYEPFVRSWRATGADFGGRFWNGMFLAPWLSLMKARLRFAGIPSNDIVFGLNDNGAMTQARVLALLPYVPDAVTEMYFHPGAFEAELAALTSPQVAAALRELQIQPFTFGELARRDGV